MKREVLVITGLLLAACSSEIEQAVERLAKYNLSAEDRAKYKKVCSTRSEYDQNFSCTQYIDDVIAAL